MAKQQSLMNLFYNIAYAIRSKTEKENLLTPEEFPEAIKSIETNDTEKLKE